ncbi:HAD family hydrolase [Clostridium sp. 19966]|uniref:HAD family hydrolase n=1 Tax=Clostridium sp. 19966 TaxID=2768166 RepID=UPI0028DE65F1|nr:HAD family hydrolase [Clostridium sp. 19966]MDT8715954.1 HAD family hydrolase [Clostridium sp. 19966]
MNIDSIIFDLDGTLWDSTEVVLKAWDKVLSKTKEVRSPITKEQMHSVMGLQLPQIAEKLFPYLDKAAGLKILKNCCSIECEFIREEGGVLYRNLEETLQKLSEKYELFIVSNCQCGYIEAFLEYHQLGKYFKGTECAGNTGLLKGENIKRVIDKYKLKASIYVGDTQGDCDAAKLADIPFVYASYGFGEVASHDYIIKEAEELAKIF